MSKYCELWFAALYRCNVKYVLTRLKGVHIEAKHFKITSFNIYLEYTLLPFPVAARSSA